MRPRYSDSLLMFFSTPTESGLSGLGSVTGNMAGTSRLYRFTGTLAAVATPKQLHPTSIFVRFLLDSNFLELDYTTTTTTTTTASRRPGHELSLEKPVGQPAT